MVSYGIVALRRNFSGYQIAERCKFASKKLVAHDGVSMLRGVCHQFPCVPAGIDTKAGQTRDP